MPAKLDLAAIARTTKYPLDAFIFVQRGLDFTVRRVHGEPPEGVEAAEKTESAEDTSRHVGGAALCWGLRDFALEQYGLMARTVLRYWHVNGTEDFGHIVYAMVEAGLMRKTEDDSVRDFFGVFDFTESFTGDLVLK